MVICVDTTIITDMQKAKNVLLIYLKPCIPQARRET